MVVVVVSLILEMILDLFRHMMVLKRLKSAKSLVILRRSPVLLATTAELFNDVI